MKNILGILGFYIIFFGFSAHAALPTCPAVQNVTAQSVYSTPPKIIVKWKGQASETSYEIWRTIDVGMPTKVITLAANQISWTDNAVSTTNNFTYDVHACVAATCSEVVPHRYSLKILM